MRLSKIVSICLSVLLACNFLTAQTQIVKNKVLAIQKELEEIRQKKFKHDINVENQSSQDFDKYLDRTFTKQFPSDLIKNYGKIVKKLGLYNGPEIKDIKSLVKTVMQSQAAAYYNPDKDTFFVLMQNMPNQMMGALYSHELHHGLQDQYFDLNQYLLDKVGGTLNDDELLARQAVIEGEATYIMTLWTTKNMIGMIPDASMLRFAINMQADLSVNQLVEILKSGAIPQSEDMQQSIKKMEEIPDFMIETMIGAYMKGMRFVFEIQQNGWEKVDELYKNPPVSTEQILHPEKWLINEKPYTYKWPLFKSNSLLKNWKLLEQNTIGEIQWRIIFSQFDFEESGVSAAEGWNGDSYAVFENSATKATLLLLITSWDSDKDAIEFESTYEKVLLKKYPNQNAVSSRMSRFENDVVIIEGENPDFVGLMELLKTINKNKN